MNQRKGNRNSRIWIWLSIGIVKLFANMTYEASAASPARFYDYLERVQLSLVSWRARANFLITACTLSRAILLMRLTVPG